MASSSSSTSMALPRVNGSNYDVFLSFRGVDTRHSFTDHLYGKLVEAGIHTFRDDDEIGRGEELKPEIETAIKASETSIVILSEKYATSSWCLDELWLILEQRREFNHFVLPIFHHVNPSDVRNNTNLFNIRVQSSTKWTEDNVNRWKGALTEVANLTGLVLSGPETSFLKDIVDIIYNKLDRKQVYLPPNLTGMDARVQKITPWLQRPDAKFLVIYGMGGSGKSTLAQFIVYQNWQYFESISIVESIGSKCKETKDLLQLQEQLFKDILGDKKRRIPTVWQGTCMIEKVLQRKKALIVLDDIVDTSQLNSLLGAGNINKESKIIITTMKNDLDNWFTSRSMGFEEYNMELLGDAESLELLCLHAFGSKIMMEGYKELAEEVVRYCEGYPLALKVLGSSLSGDNLSIRYWKSELKLLGKDIHYEIYHILKRSYDSLPHNSDKELFLHIACFFVGTDIDYVVNILEPDYSAVSRIKTLMRRCLLYVTPNKKIMMHRLLQEMGRSLVDQESPMPSKRSRVWRNTESCNILTEGKSSKIMKGLAFDMHMLMEEKASKWTERKCLQMKQTLFSAGSLENMDQLKLLQLNSVNFEQFEKDFAENLRWLSWVGFNGSTMPSYLCMGNMVALDMSYSCLEKFEPPMVLESLKILNLKSSRYLQEICDISRLPNLETLILWNCHGLVFVCKTIKDLESLGLLNMTGCENLQYSFSLPHSLEKLFLNDCNLECTDDSPLCFGDQLPVLQYLNLGNTIFERPPTFNHLKNLRVLDLSFCSMLSCLLCLPSTLAELYIYYCTSLEKVTFESGRYTLQEFGYEGCSNLLEVEDFFKLVPLAKLEEADLGHLKWLKEYESHELCLAGDDELMKGRSCHLQMLYELNIWSISLPDIKDPNIMPDHISESTSFSFDVPLCPKNKRLKGLNVSFKYTISGDDWVLFVKIKTTNGVHIMYNPKVIGKPEFGEVAIWLSYWPIGNKLNVGDSINVSIVLMNGLEIHECGAKLVYTDDKVPYDTLQNNMERVEILEDLSGFQLSTGAYYLCRRDFLELMEVGRLSPGWFSILVGDTIDNREIRGWRKTGRPQQSYQSFVELKTVKCIVYGPESEEIYKIAEMSKSSFVDKNVEFTMSILEEALQSDSMLVDPLLSESISKLLEIVVFVAKTTANFKSELKQLKITLERIGPIIDEIRELNRKLDRSKHESDMFVDEIQDARKLVQKCLKIKRNLIKRFTHSLKLKDLDQKLLRFFQIEVQAYQSRDIKQTLVEVNHVSDRIDKLAVDVRNLGQTLSNNSSMSMSFSREYETILEREKLGWRVPTLPRGIVAFEKPLEDLKAIVLADKMDCDDDGFDDGSVVVVSAPGGCGKTTLVTMLCYDAEIQAKFGEKIFFVTVSETPNFMLFVNDLLNPNSFAQQVQSQIGYENSKQNSIEDTKNKLENFLREKVSGPLLLVLDDVWSDSVIKNFTFNISGYKIVVTSRMVFPKHDKFQFDPLSDEDAKILFQCSAFPEGRRSRPTIHMDLVNQMVKCCKKHPLTLSVIGSSLDGKDETAWKDMLKLLSQGQSVLDLDLNKDILNRLERSFKALDDRFKECFLDFGLFPEDQRIPATALLNMWVHLYEHEDDGSDTLAKIFELSYRNLVNLTSISLKKDPSAVNYCEQQFVTQHDLLRELAINLSSKLPVSQRTRLIISAHREDLPTSISKVQEPMQAQILSISTGESFASRWCNMKVPEVEVLVLNLTSKTYTLPHFFNEMQKLKILNVTNYGLYPTEFENFHLLGCLSNLTRIRLERVTISSLSGPTLALPNLQKVSFIMCKMGNAFDKLNNGNSNVWPRLVEIEMDYCQDLVEFPAILCSSVHLKNVSITNCNEMCEISEEFGKLSSLETLSLRSCTKLEKLPESVTRLEKLSIIDISDCLSLSELPEEIGKLSGLRTINMKGCTGVHEIPTSVKELSSTQVICNEEISYQWQDFCNVEVIVVEDRLETLMRII